MDARRGENTAQRLSALMRRVKLEYVADWRYAEFVLMRQIKTVQAIDQLCAIRHRNLGGMPVEGVQSHGAEYRIAQSGHLFEKMARHSLAARPVPRTPLIYHQLDLVLRVEFSHDLPMSFDQ